PPGQAVYTATTINFVNPGSTGPGSGIFSNLICTSCTALTNFTSTTASFIAMTINTGTHTASITLDSNPTFTFAGNSLTITDTGTISIDGGLTPSPISFILTTQGPANQPVSYSGTITATPIPAALPLFAGGLGALGMLGWRRKKRAQSVA